MRAWIFRDLVHIVPASKAFGKHCNSMHNLLCSCYLFSKSTGLCSSLASFCPQSFSSLAAVYTHILQSCFSWSPSWHMKIETHPISVINQSFSSLKQVRLDQLEVGLQVPVKRYSWVCVCAIKGAQTLTSLSSFVRQEELSTGLFHEGTNVNIS